jgi:hypothetical protein
LEHDACTICVNGVAQQFGVTGPAIVHERPVALNRAKVHVFQE